jgi:hypothetical protein
MSAIITDQIRILNAKNFVAGVGSVSNSYYTFIGLPNPTDIDTEWNVTPPSPIDNVNQLNEYWDTMIGLKRVTEGDVTQVVRKNVWTSGQTYSMYRHDISALNPNPTDNETNLYNSNYYVLNSDYRVYVCIHNGASPENNFEGNPSLDEPTFTDLEPRSAGSSGDGYLWKYLYTIKPSDLIKFESTNYMPVPKDWETNNLYATVRDNASTSGQLKAVIIQNRGVGLGTANVYTNVPINGDGNGATATVVINNEEKVESVTISNGGSGYTFGTLDLASGNVPTGSTSPVFNIIIPPPGGHGKDVYKELGAYNVLIYSRISNNTQNPDFITGNEVARIGIIENPKSYGSTEELLSSDQASAVYALRLSGIGYSFANFIADTEITQTIGLGSTAVGRVISYDQSTGVLKYWQDRNLAGFNTNGTRNTTPKYGFKLHRFTATPGTGGSLTIVGGDTSGLSITTSYTGFTTVINNRTYNLGQSFDKGVSNPEVQKYTGNIIYVDNRPAITRSSNQKEDIKVILQF